MGEKDAHSPYLDEAISCSLTGSGHSNLKDSVTKRRSLMGLLDTDSASDSSLTKFWDNVGNITPRSYAEQHGDDIGVIFLTPNNDKISCNQFIVVHKHVDALQEEFTQVNLDLKHHLKNCETVNDDLCNKLTIGLQGMDTKYSELLIDDMFVKKLQRSVENMEKNLSEFQDVYTLFWEKAFTPLMGNVDANNLCLNELRRDVTAVKENVQSLTQKVDNMGQTVSSYEKNLDPVNQELTQVKGDLLSFRTKVSDLIDLCQQVGCFKPQGHGSADEGKVSMQHDIVLKLDMLKKSLCGLEGRMTCIETQCMQFDTRTGKMDDDVCCNACARVVDSVSINTRNVNALYSALLSEGLLTEKMGENLITNFQNGWQVVGPLFSSPASMPKGKNGVISFASPSGNHSHSTLSELHQKYWGLKG